MENKTELITSAQISKIWVEAKAAGLDSQCVHKAFVEVYHKFSMKQLTKQEAAEIIDCLCNLNGTTQEQPSTRAGMMTPQQQRYIEGMQRDLGWDGEQLRRMIQRVCNVDHLNFVTKVGAGKLIEALKAISKKRSVLAK